MKFVALSDANIISFHSIALIAAAGKKGINANKISKLTNCSRNHLFKVLETLVKANIIYSTRGPKAGYYLNKPANKILLIDVFEALNGKVIDSELCVGRNTQENSFLFFTSLCEELTFKFLNYLRSTKISDLEPKAQILLNSISD